MRRGPVLLFLCLLLLACLLLPHAGATTTSLSSRNADPTNVLMTTLTKQGYNATADGGLGGLWLSWRMGSNPLQTNFSSEGIPATVKPPQFDRLLNLDYLADLWQFTQVHPHDVAALAARTRFTTIVRHEWVAIDTMDVAAYPVLVNLAHLAHDPWYLQQAQQLVDRAVAELYHPNIGAIYWVALPDLPGGHPDGWYRSDWVIAVIAAMTREGVRRNMPEWITDARRSLTFLDTHADLPQYHVYLQRMGGVVLQDGTSNPNEIVLRSSEDGYSDDGGTIRGEAAGQEILAFLAAYQAEPDSVFLQHAIRLLDAFSPQTTQLGIWDFAQQGYDQVQFTGLDAVHPGNPVVLLNAKFALDQEWLLAACQVALPMMGAQYKHLVETLQHILLTNLFDAVLRGVPTARAADWTLLVLHGNRHDWVDAYAMVLALHCLLTAAL